MASLLAAPAVDPLLAHGIDLPPPATVIRPPSADKGVWWSRLPYSVDTENFSIQWRDASIPSAIADQVGADMELAWVGLIETHGWALPTTAESHLITVVLEPDMESTGLTYAEPTDEHPMGVPIIYINPTYAEYTEFMTSLCAHEFGHALQYRWRDWNTSSADEPWFWEASAEWQAELAVPTADTYAWSSAHYAAAPHATFSSMLDYHQYGMFVLNAYIDEYEVGADGFRSIWEANEGMPWLDELERVVGLDAVEIWADLAGAYGAKSLRESSLYTEPITVDGTTPLEGWLGHHYIPLGQIDGRVRLDSGVGTLVRDGEWLVFEGIEDIPPGDGDVWLAVTNPNPDPLYYTVSLLPPDTGEPEDTGTDDEPGADTGGVPGDGIEPGGTDPEQLGAVGGSDDAKGCGCTTARVTGAGWFWLALGLAWRRRA